MRAVTLSELDLTGAQIKGELRLGILGDKNTTWKSYMDRNKKSHSPKLTLRDATVGTIRDDKDAWPENLGLEGFTYERFGKAGRSVFNMRTSDWFAGWLAKDSPYTPQPYRHLVSHLRDAGHEGKAEHILYANRERERWDSRTLWIRWFLLSGLWLIFGYGYGWRSFLTLFWAGLFVFIGTVVLRKIKELDRDGDRLGFWYSLDMLLPAIRLREQHYEVDLKTGTRYYFYVHKIIGYTLAFFLLAGLSGLTRYLAE